MKKKFSLLPMALCLMLVLSEPSNADVKVTFVNKTERKVSVVTMVYVSAVATKGWHNIDPGKSKTIVWKGPSYPGEQMSHCIGYYAKASKKGVKTIFWKEGWMEGPIHPTKAFHYQDYAGADKENNIPKNAPTVKFRQIKNWKINGSHASAIVNLSM